MYDVQKGQKFVVLFIKNNKFYFDSKQCKYLNKWIDCASLTYKIMMKETDFILLYKILMISSFPVSFYTNNIIIFLNFIRYPIWRYLREKCFEWKSDTFVLKHHKEFFIGIKISLDGFWGITFVLTMNNS